jgi:hypothetical protein
MVMSATSLSDVSLIAIVPDSEWRIPTLMGPVSFVGLGAGALAAGAAVVGAVDVDVGASFFAQAASRARETSAARLLCM